MFARPGKKKKSHEIQKVEIFWEKEEGGREARSRTPSSFFCQDDGDWGNNLGCGIWEMRREGGGRKIGACFVRGSALPAKDEGTLPSLKKHSADPILHNVHGRKEAHLQSHVGSTRGLITLHGESEQVCGNLRPLKQPAMLKGRSGALKTVGPPFPPPPPFSIEGLAAKILQL